jgi:hypothetical protein
VSIRPRSAYQLTACSTFPGAQMRERGPFFGVGLADVLAQRVDAAGVPVDEGPEAGGAAGPWLGYASAELTLNLYGHQMGTDSDRAGIARINQILGKTRRTRKRSAGTDDSDAGASAN